MDIDDALARVGGFRRWHLTLFSLLSLAMCMPIAFHSLAIVFVGWEPPHHCKLGDGQTLSSAIPLEKGPTGELQASRCNIYINGTNNTEFCPNGWTYNSKYRTIVSEWDLVCGQNFLAELSQTIMQIGGLAGELLGAIFIDKLGRKKVFISTFVWVGMFGIGCSFAPNYAAFVALQTVIALGISACIISGLILMMELFDSSKRTEVGIGVEAFWVIDYVIVPLIGYLALYWRHFELFISLVCLIWIVFIWILPESPTWLAANHRYDEAERELQRMARLNGVKNVPARLLPQQGQHSQDQELLNPKSGLVINGDTPLQSGSELLNKAKEAEADNVSKPTAERRSNADKLRFHHLFTDNKLRRHTLVSMALWFANMTVYYGIILFTPSLAGDRFVNFLMSALIEIPAYIVSYFICKKVGRKMPTCVAHVMAGACLILTPFIPQQTASGINLGPLSTTLALMGKFFICISFAIILLYTKELFPTNLRGSSGGLSLLVGRLGSMAAPFAVYSAKRLIWLPGLIMGAISIVVGFICLCLPETKLCPLPQDLDDIHNMYKQSSDKRTNKDEQGGLTEKA